MLSLFVKPFPGNTASNLLAKPHHDANLVEDEREADFIIIQPELVELTSTNEGLGWFEREIQTDPSRKVVLFSHDTDLPMRNFFKESFICFRTSMTMGHEYHLEHLIPPIVSRSVEALTEYNLVFPYSKKPTISFVGHVSSKIDYLLGQSQSSYKPRLETSNRESVFGSPVNIGLFLRRIALNVLSRNWRIRLDLIERDQHFAHAGLEKKNAWASQYFDSMVQNQYVLCIRGAGNYSIRLYETMAAGRIPIILNTDQYLFRPDYVPWKENSVWVESRDIHKIDELVLDFHTSRSEAELIRIASDNVDIHSKYMSSPGVRGFVAQVLKEAHALR